MPPPSFVEVATVVTTAATCPQPNADVCLSGGTVLDADVARFDYVGTHGGLYLDTDARRRVAPAHWPRAYPGLPWAAATLVVGVEFPRPIGRGADGCCLQFVNWAFASAPGCRILAEVAEAGQRAIARGARVRDAVHATGPGLFTRVLLRHIGHAAFDLAKVEAGGHPYTSRYTNETIIVLPYRAFGVHPAHRGTHINPNPPHQQLVRHGFRGSWRARRRRR